MSTMTVVNTKKPGFFKRCMVWCFNGKKGANEVIIHSCPEFIYFWPLVPLGLLFYSLSSYGLVGSETMAWIYINVFLICALTVGVDMGRNASLFTLIATALLWFFGTWLRDKQGIPLIDQIFGFFHSLTPQYSADFGLAVSLGLGVIFAVILVKVAVDERYRFTNNEIEHIVFGMRDDSIARGAKRIKVIYTDILELLLCGAGTVEVYSAQGKQLLATVKNVPFLVFRAKKISHILESMAVTPADESDGEPEEEGAHG